MARVIDYDFGISAIDAGFHRPLHVAIHLVAERGRAAIVDSGTHASVPHVLAALAAKGIAAAAVDYLILTHVHLDHAGGAGALMQAMPNAMLTVHPRGARHVADPSRLIEGTRAVYGEDATRRMYGDIVPVPRERIVETPEGFALELAGRELSFLDTPGHARHHVVVRDARSGHVFAGDTFGVAYTQLDFDGRRYAFPTTSPTQFDPDAAHRSLDRLTALDPGAIYVTHYGRVTGIARMAEDLHRLLDAHERIARAAQHAGARRNAVLAEGVRELVLAEAERHRWPLARERVLELFAIDIELNALGLASWLDSLAPQGQATI
ncbi:MAG TPA: MBL fold metallo-hydrolase [Burkholderiales bacterium]|nr:MBL fold metallo-hydrolase [Burkholderiales bacterium]